MLMLKRLVDWIVQPDPAETTMDTLLEQASENLLSDDPDLVEQGRRARANLGRVKAAGDKT